jgi:hypothetical protein
MAEVLKLADFLTNVPPGVERAVGDLSASQNDSSFNIPTLYLHCDSKYCGDLRFFNGKSRYNNNWSSTDWDVGFMQYLCCNCGSYGYLFCVRALRTSGSTAGTAIKVGQWPALGAPLPTKLVTLLGADRDLLIKAHRAELQGLGVGAFAYYRRIVENQRGRIFDAIIRVAGKEGDAGEFTSDLERAKAEKQFTKSVETIKASLPTAFRIDGHNPLTLLHDALSDGIHTLSDEECLQRATVVRTVLAALAQRLAELSTENSDLKKAVSTLLQKDRKPPPTSSLKPGGEANGARA